MRYFNQTSTGKFSTLANRTVQPGGVTPRLNLLSAAVEEAARRSGGMLAVLDSQDVESLMRLVRSTAAARKAMASAPPPESPESQLERALVAMTDRYEEEKKADFERVSSQLAEEKRIHDIAMLEDSDLDENGNVVPRDKSALDGRIGGIDASSIPPKFSEPGSAVTAEDVIAHNKAVADAERASSRSDKRPAYGQEAVEMSRVPGVPNMPGMSAPGGLYESIRRESGTLQAPGTPKWDDNGIGKAPPSSISGIDLSGYPRSDAMQRGAAARNYGRK